MNKELEKLKKHLEKLKEEKELKEIKKEIKIKERQLNNLKSKLINRNKPLVFKVSKKEEIDLLKGAVKNKITISEEIRRRCFNFKYEDSLASKKLKRIEKGETALE